MGMLDEEVRTEADMRKSAELIVDTCFGVEEDDVVTIITDDRRKEEAEMVAQVVSERGGWPIVMNNETQVSRAMKDTHFPMIPPRNLHQAMVTSDEIIIITNLEWANRFARWKKALVAGLLACPTLKRPLSTRVMQLPCSRVHAEFV